MKKILIISILLLLISACTTHTHSIGNGSQTGETVSQRQWYAAWGLASINDVNTDEMSEDAVDYEITTEQTVVDGLFTGCLGIFTLSCRTVTVTK